MIGTYKYEDPVKQRCYFRGYVRVYEGQTVTNISCSEVRTNQSQALKDAKKLGITLKTKHARVVA